jgi:hypothetical protein
MKKLLAIMALALSSTAFAADFVSVAVDQVTDRSDGSKSTAQYIRAGKEMGGIQYGLQSRTSRSSDGSGLFNSLELTAGKNYGVAGLNVTPFVGVGYDNTMNGSEQPYRYGLVGATAGKQVGPGYALAGVKTRVGSSEAERTKQTVTFVQYAYPVAKNVAVTAGLSRSTQDIKERATSIGVQIGF